MNKNLSVLFNHPLFKDVAEKDIPVMVKKLGAVTRKYSKNSFISSTGDSADFIGIVLYGHIQILQDDFCIFRQLRTSLYHFSSQSVL